MALGTAGFTAALAIHRMEQNGQSPQGGADRRDRRLRRCRQHRDGHARHARLRVVAVSGKSSAAAYLQRARGRTRCWLRQELDLGTPPAGDRALRRRHRQPRRRDARPGSRAAWTSGATSPASGWPAGAELEDHRDALHPARREPARHQLLGHAARAAAGGVAAHRHGPQAAPPRRASSRAPWTSTSCRRPFPPYLDGAVTGRTVVRIG